MDLEVRRKRVMYQASHRGFKEADLVIGTFAASHAPSMTEPQLFEFEALLEAPDHDLYSWITGASEPPANLDGAVLRRLQAHCRDGAAAQRD